MAHLFMQGAVGGQRMGVILAELAHTPRWRYGDCQGPGRGVRWFMASAEAVPGPVLSSTDVAEQADRTEQQAAAGRRVEADEPGEGKSTV